jgi:hypothetical protein
MHDSSCNRFLGIVQGNPFVLFLPLSQADLCYHMV